MRFREHSEKHFTLFGKYGWVTIGLDIAIEMTTSTFQIDLQVEALLEVENSDFIICLSAYLPICYLCT